MPWDQTEQYIRSGHRDPGEFKDGSFRTIDINEQKGIKTVIGKPKGKDTMEVQSFLFDKSKGWTLDKAKAWFGQHKNESVKLGIRIHAITERLQEKRIRGVAAYAGISRNDNFYLPEELKKANGLKVPLNWEHDYSLPPVGVATFRWNPEKQYLEFDAEISDATEIPPHVSIGADYDWEDYYEGYRIPRGLKFYELSLTKNPGFPLTSVAVAENVRRIFEHVGLAEWNTLARLDQTGLSSEEKSRAGADLMKAAKDAGIGQFADSKEIVIASSSRDGETMAALQRPDSGAGDEKQVSEKEKTENKEPSASPTNLPAQPTTAEHAKYVTYEDFVKAQEKLLKTFEESMSWLRPEKQNGNGKKPVIPAEETVAKQRAISEEEMEQKFYEDLAEKLWGMPAPYSTYETAFRFTVPRLDLPPISIGSLDEAFKERAKLLESFSRKVQVINRRVTEALATTTSGASLGVYGVSPLVVLPNDLIANLRDIVNWIDLPRGVDRARWATIQVAAAAALTQNIEPTEATQTLTSVDAVPSSRGLQQSISYELEQKTIGGSMIQAVVESFRLSYLADIDYLVNTEADTATPAKTLYGDESVSAEANVTSSMTMAPARIASSITEITKKGYNADNLVAVLHPVQFDALLKHTDIRQAHIFGENVQVTGVIPSLYGVEVRRSTKVVTGTGSASITTYHGYVCKKGITFGVGASRDIQVETFRDIRKNQTVVKGHWDVAAKAIQPNTFVKIVSA